MVKPIAKPIFLVGISFEHVSQIEDWQKVFENKFNDYHVILYFIDDRIPKFDVFYEKDFKEADFKELKKIVKQTIDKPKKRILNDCDFARK